MKFYEFGKQDNPAHLLLPGTCSHWKNNFGHVIKLLQYTFLVVCVSYDGFDETEQVVFPDMITETEKIESYLSKRFAGKIHAAYGCSMGGSFVGHLLQRKRIQMEHGILGSSDLGQKDGYVSQSWMIGLKQRIRRCIAYAAKMGSQYLERYRQHFINPDIIKHDLNHEELLACQP